MKAPKRPTRAKTWEAIIGTTAGYSLNVMICAGLLTLAAVAAFVAFLLAPFIAWVMP
ncbi:MAG: hypothetical protein AAF192_00275 [Pseudomonadota bacterium]